MKICMQVFTDMLLSLWSIYLAVELLVTRKLFVCI